jgi:activator of HSP90 ATPase
MTDQFFTRRVFSTRLAALFPAVGIMGATRLNGAAGSSAVSADEISHMAEAIHQEITLNASPKHVYQALTDAKQFDKLVILSGITPKKFPTEISSEVGGTFSIFEGHIIGRNLELVPNQRIVQAWRVVTWDPGMHSIAKFELNEQGAATKIVFDHTGFPVGLAQSLADGWKEHYWSTLEKYLA